ncbi:zinc knuckle CX2CX4HX4C containing protein [Tanacetum coccineum]
MRINELRYNFRRMWSRYRLKEVIENDCGMFFFKFHHEEGMNYVMDNGPWMVNNKPLVVQKWDINMVIAKTEPDKLPLWVRFCNPPLEALTVKGISALASRIGKPLIMDARTTSMCSQNVGRIGYARVLIEVPAKKGLPDEIDIVYKNAAKEVIGKKSVKVIYDWAPGVCSECGVFGYTVKMCPKCNVNVKSTDTVSNVNNDHPNTSCNVQMGKQQHDDFIKVVNKKFRKQNISQNKNNWAHPKTVYKQKKHLPNRNDKKMGSNSSVIRENSVNTKGTENVINKSLVRDKSRDKPVSLVVHKENRSANKYSVLEDLDDEEVLSEDDMGNVKGKQGDKGNSIDLTREVEDVYSIEDGIARNMNEGDLKGMDEDVLQDY